MKKIVFLPYDFDTALGINNEGALTFSYNLEDIDQIEGGANVFNGQQSVLWQNMRAAFYEDIKAMYQTLRSQNVLSYEVVEKMFEDHQNKWPEAIFNEDAFFKYLQPLIDDGSGAYLAMLQGSKAEQRKWWLYNRFRYIDSKYNAGDSLSDVIQLRGYAKANITVTPYADVYPSIKYGSYLVQERGARNVPTELVNPLDEVNDTEIYIYSASQLASVGDLSGLKVGYADFSMATKLQSLKIGDADSSYSNGNLKELTLGNNVLLQTIDVRNCPNLTQAVDISGCTNIEEVYFGGTAITGLTLPNGGVLKVLQLPETITNLTIRNQPAITSFSMPSYENITTLRLENVGSVVDPFEILDDIPANSRVRLIGFTKAVSSTAEVDAFIALLDTMRGLDEAGNNVDTAQVSGTITGLDTITGAWLAGIKAKYPDLNVEYEHISSNLYYYNYDGSELLYTETITDGGDGAYSGTPGRSSTAQYTYTFAGWSREKNATSGDADATKNVVADRSVYAAYTQTVNKYTVTFVRASADGGGTLQTLNNVAYGTTPSYTGATPTSTQGEEYEFTGWTPALGPITGNTTYTAVFVNASVEVVEIADSWDQIIANIDNGTYATKYKVGNYKPLDLGTEGVINMQIVGIDYDELASGGNAPLTFIGIELLKTLKSVNPVDYESPFSTSGLRTYLTGTIRSKIPSNIATRLKSVNKQCDTKTSTETITDSIWIPSFHEMGVVASHPHYKIYGETNNRIKKRDGVATIYWTRDKYTTSFGFRTILSNGYSGDARGTNNFGVALGFCLGTAE